MDDLKLIRGLLAKNKEEITDIQPCLLPDGHIIIIDPTDILSGVSKEQLLTLSQFIDTVEHDLVRIAREGRSTSNLKFVFNHLVKCILRRNHM